ncbi:NADPH-dependent 2,4-dienoyl-CoA reductase [Micrococcus luteus]|nr:NADPH-dependent 2,4-dienoyl-CoA reductase [Micrococcus luteus]
MTSSPVAVSPLLQPITLGPLTLPNRVVMASMHMGLEDRHDDLPQLAAFYAERARGGVGLIVTGGLGVVPEGTVTLGGGMLASEEDARAHRVVTDAVHAAGGRILAQLLHAGRYAPSPDLVSASAVRAPISRHTPREMTAADIERTVNAFARAATLALEAGYDGVEIMASEGYLLNQFLAPATNRRADEYGGDAERRRRFPVAVVAAVREALGERGVLSVRTSAADLVPDGQTRAEIADTARAFEAAGADVLMTGIGWHESRVPTIVTSVPRAAFLTASADLTAAVDIPVIASNRLTTPAEAEEALTSGAAALVGLARPLLADPEWMAAISDPRARTLTPCIACNQACLDHVFTGAKVSCLMNPRAGRETEPEYAAPVPVALGRRRRIAVVGAGPAGLTAAERAARFGHEVTLFDRHAEPGGQFRLARRIPGKEEFGPALEHLAARAAASGVTLVTGEEVSAQTLLTDDGRPGYDEVLLTTGVRPRPVDLPGAGEPGAPAVHAYDDVVLGHVDVGPRVAVIGAGGVGVDVAEALAAGTERPDGTPETQEHWRARWGVALTAETPGQLAKPAAAHPGREVHLLQRSPGPIGARLRPTTGWVHRAELRQHGVHLHSGVTYEGLGPDGLRVTAPSPEDPEARVALTLDVTDVVVCAGQESETDLVEDLVAAGYAPEAVRLIGGAAEARELDAYRAMDHAVRAVQG